MKSWVLFMLLAVLLLMVGCGKPALPTPSKTENSTQKESPAAAPDSGKRVEVALCVQVSDIPALSQERVVSSVKNAMETIVKHANWPTYMESPNKVIRVNDGCPSKPYLLEPGSRHPVLYGGGGPKPLVEPSGYRAFVFVVSDQEIARIFGNSSLRVAPQEKVCQGNNCWETAAALYLTAKDVSDPARIEDGLLKVLGLVQPYGP